jgi:hypothetical protein
VDNESGCKCYHFPVADYLPDHVPASDVSGVLVFHHVPWTMVGGTEYELFGTILLGEHGGPAYVCRFLLAGREVGRLPYGDLVNRGAKTVRRRWKWLTWPELQGSIFHGLEWDQTEPSRLRLFDLNGNGKIDRDEGYVARAAYDAQERAAEIMAGRKPEWEELEFALEERTVIVDLP